jgi:hypothetical protein
MCYKLSVTHEVQLVLDLCFYYGLGAECLWQKVETALSTFSLPSLPCAKSIRLLIYTKNRDPTEVELHV